MQLTRMPNGPAWAATCCVSSAIPALAAAYGMGERGSARRPAAEPMVTTQPRRRSQLGLDLAADCLDLCEVGQLAGHPDDAPATPGDRDVADCRQVASVHRDQRAAPRELVGDGRSDAPRAAGDQGDLAA
jgi:hypothetical protein